MADERLRSKSELKRLFTNLKRRGITDDMVSILIDVLWRDKPNMRYSGFELAGGADAVIQLNTSTRVFSIEPFDPEVEGYRPVFGIYSWAQRATLHRIYDRLEITIPNQEGLFIIYFSANEETRVQQLTVLKNPTEDELKDIYENEVIIAAIYWDTTTGTPLYYGDCRHGSEWNPQIHWYLHNSIGAQIKTGLIFTGFIVNGDGSLDAHAQLSIAEGVMMHDDFEMIIPSSGQTIPILYFSGGSPKFLSKSNFSVYSGTGLLCYNGLGTIVACTEEYYVIYHYFATNEILHTSRKTISVMGTNEYETLGDAYMNAEAEYIAIRAEMPQQGKCYLGSVIFQTSAAYTNTIKARVVGIIGDKKQHPPVTIAEDSKTYLEITDEQVLSINTEDLGGGTVGPQGPQGDSITGPQGPQGDSVTGAQGPQGDSITGAQGPQGDSITGAQGPQGDSITGAQGPQGDSITGAQGPQGDSITGAQGPQGDSITGPQGAQGNDGTGVAILGSVSTYTNLPGYPNSYTGDIGDGYMANDTGHLWVWDGSVWNDVGEIRGPQGYQGASVTGAQGPQGASVTGAQGPQGASVTGAQGPQGASVTGAQGPQGASVTGAQGPQGASVTGAQGPQGASVTGAQGPQGASVTGAQGPQGASIIGPRGYQGYPGVAGATWYYTADPTPPTSTGVVGDYALSTYGGVTNIWRKTGTTTWTWTSNIQGPQGNQGDTGVGVQGPRGYQGVPGSNAPGYWTDAGDWLYPTNGERISIGKTTNSGNNLEVAGPISFNDFFGMNCYYSSGWKFIGTGYAMMMKQETGAFSIYISTASGTANAAITWKNMTITNVSGAVTAYDFVLTP